MITAVDTNVLLDVFIADATFLERSRAALRRSIGRGRVVACDVVWADRLLTRDRGFYRTYFAELELLDPTAD